VEDAGVLSPDGTKLAYVSTKGGARTANIWVMDLATRQARNLTGDGRTEPPQLMNGHFRPAWSPDGQWIAFSSDRGEKWQGAVVGCVSVDCHQLRPRREFAGRRGRRWRGRLASLLAVRDASRRQRPASAHQQGRHGLRHAEVVARRPQAERLLAAGPRDLRRAH